MADAYTAKMPPTRWTLSGGSTSLPLPSWQGKSGTLTENEKQEEGRTFMSIEKPFFSIFDVTDENSVELYECEKKWDPRNNSNENEVGNLL